MICGRVSHERPIIFSAPMIRAILAGRKTQTRRLVKPQPDLSNLKPSYRDLGFEFRRMPILGPTHIPVEWGFVTKHDKPGAVPIFGYKCPYGKPGDLLWVRETTIISPPDFGTDRDAGSIIDSDGKHRIVQYIASYPDTEAAGWYGLKKRPSIHMPKWAARIWLRITNVRVERLQDISWRDIRSEGVDCPEHDFQGGFCADECRSLRNAWVTLWDSINAKRVPWESNPWVWVIEFEIDRVES